MTYEKYFIGNDIDFSSYEGLKKDLDYVAKNGEDVNVEIFNEVIEKMDVEKFIRNMKNVKYSHGKMDIGNSPVIVAITQENGKMQSVFLDFNKMEAITKIFPKSLYYEYRAAIEKKKEEIDQLQPESFSSKLYDVPDEIDQFLQDL